MLATALCVGLLAWACRRVELSRLPEVVSGVQLQLLWGVASLRVGAWSLRALRFRQLLAARLQTPPRRVLRASYVGAFFNLFLPLRGGEAARVALLRRHNDLSLPELIASAALDRLLDLLAVCSLAVLALPGAALPGWLGVAAGWVGGLALTALVLVSVGRTFVRRMVLTLGERGFGRTVTGLVVPLVDALAVVQHRRRLVLALATGALGWLVEALGAALMMLAFGLPLDVRLALLLTCGVALGMAVPAGPGGLGPHQFVYVSLLSLRGVNAEAALSMSLLSVALTALLLAAISAPALWLESVEVSRPRRSPGSPW